MCANYIPSDIEEIKHSLFRRMEQEHGERGDYAVKMLKTAERLLKLPSPVPHLSTAIASCIRQATIEIFQTTKDNNGSWNRAFKQAADAGHRLSGTSSPNREIDVQCLIDAVGELEDLNKCGSAHQARLRATIMERTRLDPLTGDGSLFAEYQQLIDNLNRLVHLNPHKVPTDLDATREHYEKAIDILANMFLPKARQERIIQLAKLAEPRDADAVRLKGTMSSANDFYCFARHMHSSTWLEIMDDDMLALPTKDSPWLIESIAHYQKDRHHDAIIRCVEKNWDRWATSDEGLNRLGHVGLKLGDHGLSLLVHALKTKSSPFLLCGFAMQAYSRTNPASPQLVDLADHLLNPNSGADKHHKIHTIPKKLVEGMDLPSSEERIRILVYKLQDYLKPGYPYSISLNGSIASVGQNARYVEDGLVGSMIDAFQKAKQLGKPTPSLVRLLDPLPEGMKSRFVAWLYSQADDVNCSKLIDFVVSSCCSRKPTGDDRLLLDRLERDGNIAAVATQAADVIGNAPEPEDVADILQSTDNVDRRILWGFAVSLKTNLPGWERCRGVLTTPGVSRGSTEQSRHITHAPLGSEDPTAQEELDLTDPHTMASRIAAWRQPVGDSLGLTIAHGVERELEDAVRCNASEWAKDPSQIIELLQYSTYVARYFRGLANAKDPISSYADQLIPAIRHVRAHHLPTVPWGLHPFDYDPIWNNPDTAGIDLIETMIQNDAQLSKESLSDAWALVRDAVADRTAQSSGNAGNYMDSAISRPCTRALHTMLCLVQYGVENRKDDLPEWVWTVLTESLQLTNSDGAEHRAIIAPWTSFLRFALPNRFAQIEPILFGSEAPRKLGQVSLDVYLGWDKPDEYMLKNYRDGVLDAVSRDVLGAMDCLLLGMFWNVDGYDQKCLVESLAKIGSEYVSLAGEHCARILCDKANVDSIPQGIIFWEHVLGLSPKPEALAGYMMWADVSALDQNQWERLMLQTCKLTNKRLSRAEPVARQRKESTKTANERPTYADLVAERIKRSPKITNAGLRILTLVIKIDLDPLAIDIVVECSSDALHRSTNKADLKESRDLLYDAMVDRGYDPSL